jgi:translocator protein
MKTIIIMRKGFNSAKLASSLVLCFAAAAAGSIFTFPSIGTWYAGLVKPAFTPPNWAFGPVWTSLYILMAFSLYLVWNKSKEKKPLIAFGIQLSFNVFWSAVFFGIRSLFGGLVIIAFLWISVFACTFIYWGIDRRASWLLIPYLSWVGAASYLNLGLWVLNQ